MLKKAGEISKLEKTADKFYLFTLFMAWQGTLKIFKMQKINLKKAESFLNTKHLFFLVKIICCDLILIL